MQPSTIHLGDVAHADPQPPHPAAVHRPRRRFAWRIVWSAIAIIFAWYGWALIAGHASWRAVFLTNNQVYFGHFWDVPFAPSITLSDVYYLEVAQPNQQFTGDQSQQLKLVRLGSEIHGPTDGMTIPMGQVLFWETLRPDSAVVAAIKSLAQPQ